MVTVVTLLCSLIKQAGKESQSSLYFLTDRLGSEYKCCLEWYLVPKTQILCEWAAEDRPMHSVLMLANLQYCSARQHKHKVCVSLSDA